MSSTGTTEVMLADPQRQRAVAVMREFLSAPIGPERLTPLQVHEENDRNRAKVINEQLRPLLDGYFGGAIGLSEFKTRVDSINKRNQLWGFKGIKGQMFFNMLTNAASDEAELDQELKSALVVPANEQIAASRIRTFASYVNRIGDDFVAQGNKGYGRPKVSSIPFFLSYFWQIQNPKVWPVYYTNSVQTMTDLNLWQPKDDVTDDYLTYKHIHEELATLYTKEAGRPFDLYQVEHVFWFKGGNPYGTTSTVTDPGPKIITGTAHIVQGGLPQIDSFVPPIVAFLPRIAVGEDQMEEVAKQMGTSLARQFEKSIDAAFTLLGYDSRLLGQGKGRVPDGLAKALDDNYAILWDGKIRESGYSMGTDDRTIKEYITTQAREQKRNGRLRNIYYVIISSGFTDDFDEVIRSLKMETDVNEVILMEAAALVAMVDAKLRQPIQITLGPDGMQRLLTNSGVLTAEMVREELA